MILEFAQYKKKKCNSKRQNDDDKEETDDNDDDVLYKVPNVFATIHCTLLLIYLICLKPHETVGQTKADVFG